jgi:hypothetical protein
MTLIEDRKFSEDDPANRRRHERTCLILKGRYMLCDGAEFPCETTDVSPSGVGIRGFRSGPIGSKVVAYIEDFGRVEGTIVRRFPGWFALAFVDYAGKESRLSDRIDRLIAGDGIERRRTPRMDQIDAAVVMRHADGRETMGVLLDVSLDGALLSVESDFAVAEHIRVGEQEAEVVRVTSDGVAVRFV